MYRITYRLGRHAFITSICRHHQATSCWSRMRTTWRKQRSISDDAQMLYLTTAWLTVVLASARCGNPACLSQMEYFSFFCFLFSLREYVFTGFGLSVCLSVCLSLTTITKKIVDGFVPHFMGRFLGGKGRPSSCFVMIGRGTDLPSILKVG